MSRKRDVIVLKKQWNGLFVLFLIFCFMYILNTFTPLLSDDYFIAFVWPEGSGINEVLPANAKKISSFSDVYASLKTYYLTWGGRIPGQSFMTIFSWWGKTVFNFVNAFVAVLLLAEIYWISHDGIINLDFDPAYIFWSFFALWSFNAVFTDVFLWLSGACEYLWMMVIILAFLIPYLRNYYNPDLHGNNTIPMSLIMFLLGLLSGCSRETIICWIIVILSYWLFICWKNHDLQIWKVTGLTGLCIGYLILLFAPGNVARLSILNKAASTIDLLLNMKGLLVLSNYSKLFEVLVIIYFHLFLWYFLISFLLKNKNIVFQKDVLRNLNVAKVSVLIAFCSGILILVIPAIGLLRPSFVNLVFLVIATACIFRLEEKTGITVLERKLKLILKFCAYSFFILTVSVSLVGNCLNYRDWKNVIELVKTEQHNPTNMILEVAPYYTEEHNFKAWKFLSGDHIVWNPLSVNKNNGINLSFSRYYGIKGIKVLKGTD